MLSTLCQSDAVQRVWLFSGKFHPVVVHFPIALLIVGVTLEFLRWRRGVTSPSSIASTCIILGAFSACFAAAIGWSDALTAGHQEDVLGPHRWLGIATVCIGLLAAIFAAISTRLGTYRIFNAYRASAVAAAVLAAITGHFGGGLVYGPGYVDRAIAILNPPTSQPMRESGSTNVTVDFVRDVRPILARRCLSCHSGGEPAGGLNLDDHASVLRGGKSGQPTVVAGNSASSRLVRLISGHERDLLMPPKGGPLEQDQIATLTRWIDQGANWADAHDSGEHWHWAYRQPKRATLPAVKDTYWPRNAIDYFVLARLEREGLTPSTDASRETMIRRVSLDLIGLPPTPAEIDTFVADHGADAYEKVVDRLLDSPRYGERWAQIWLDLARYSDTHGYEKDARRVMWPYRDWVIDAFNRDLPFDQFTIEQIAGDMLPEPSLAQLVATGYHRNTMINEEGGVDQEEFRVDAVIDRVNTTASVWLGSTVGCAQCHDHKYDPISQREYYQLFAFLNQDDADSVSIGPSENRAAGRMVPVPDHARFGEFEELLKQAEAAERELSRPTPERMAAQAAWETTALRPRDDWAVLTPTGLAASDGVKLTAQPDGSVLASGPSPEKAEYTLEYQLSNDLELAGLRLEVLPDPSNAGASISTSGLVGRSDNGNFVLNELKADVVTPTSETQRLRFNAAGADYEQDANFGHDAGWPAAATIDGETEGRGWAIGGSTDRAHVIVLRAEKQISVVAGSTVRVTLAQNYGAKHTIGRCRVSVPKQTPDPSAVVMPLPPDVSELLRISTDQRTVGQSERLAIYYRGVAPEFAPLRERATVLRTQVSAMTVASAQAMRTASPPRETHVHIRGSFLNKGEQVVPEVPAVLANTAGSPERKDRLGFARWLVDPKNPLTARVASNRLWARLFGRGIVETEEDFGTQGDPPTHPELLDWLATEFVRVGWSQKAMLRSLVTSSAYRQSSAVSPRALEKDPFNKLISRGPRFRVEAEMIRDIALSASGLLSGKIGGPSVFPPQPPGVWTMIYSNDQWIESTGEDKHRRGLYTFWRRTAPYPMFSGFDAPSRELVCVRRTRTNTPLQALTTLNDPQFVEAANALAMRMIAEAGTDPDARIELGFKLCVSRSPTGTERDRVYRLYQEQMAVFTKDPASAQRLTGTTGDYAPEIAAWQVVANVLLNLDEALTKG